MIPMRGELLDEYCMEYNDVLTEKMLGEYRFKQEKYITVMVRKKNVEEARGYFRRVGAELGSRFAALGSVCDVLELHGGRPEWKEVLAVYAVKTNNDPNDSDELITMTSKKEKLLRDVFWDMVNV
ncbi:MAG: hypothetical protein IJN46_11070, partial [Lachnospiraceae bacterium]|nr:hypothetical protein [Lachnospiraceae bacterium]